MMADTDLLKIHIWLPPFNVLVMKASKMDKPEISGDKGQLQVSNFL